MPPAYILIALTDLSALLFFGSPHPEVVRLLIQLPAPQNLPAQIYLPSLARPHPTAPTAPTAAPICVCALSAQPQHHRRPYPNRPLDPRHRTHSRRTQRAVDSTRHSFLSKISSNTGSFTVCSDINSPRVKLSATNFYLNAVRGSLSAGNVQLADHPSKLYLALRGIERRWTKPVRPQTNSFVKHFIRTVKEELSAQARRRKLYESMDKPQADLDDRLRSYNYERPHQGYRNLGRKPIGTLASFLTTVNKKPKSTPYGWMIDQHRRTWEAQL